ncbi:carbohydrate ABC transporter permease [Jiangella asiatica]|uniref:Carbohydrate ABC transporter permease n=1 Tax=Jiangella asiatica TaxID=2530372 RepID=A0A4R5DED5_9ACTN|nr:carbohydrate ABC transporter permease [Jiangella asiatica]TDE11457.1 carbohydrate ABC transporter permease [Jiangella asiatica]
MTTVTATARTTQTRPTAARLPRYARYTALTVAALATGFPFYAMLVIALKPPTAVIELPGSLWPWPLTTETIRTALAGGEIARWTLNSVIYSAGSTVVIVALASLAGYAFAKKRFAGRDTIFWSIVSMMMIPYHLTLVPLFILVAQAGGINTYWGLIVPTLANVHALFLMRQFIMGIPDEIIDAARVDGAGELRIYWSLVLPLVRPIVATVGLFMFLWHWNDFLWPLVVGQSEDMRTLTVGVAGLRQQETLLPMEMAGVALAFLPIMAVYVVAQRHFLQAAMMSGMKG